MTFNKGRICLIHNFHPSPMPKLLDATVLGTWETCLPPLTSRVDPLCSGSGMAENNWRRPGISAPDNSFCALHLIILPSYPKALFTNLRARVSQIHSRSHVPNRPFLFPLENDPITPLISPHTVPPMTHESLGQGITWICVSLSLPFILMLLHRG